MIGAGARLRDPGRSHVRPQELLLSRPAQGLPDHRSSTSRSASAGWLTIDGEPRRRSTAPTSRRTPASSCTPAARPIGDAVLAGRLQPLRRAADGDRLRARPALARARRGAYLRSCAQLLQTLGVSDGNMQEGSLRCDANVSLRPAGRRRSARETESRTSTRSAPSSAPSSTRSRARSALLEAGGRVVQETRRWNDERGPRARMRSKEYAHDYRYFPEPDLPPLFVRRRVVERLRAAPARAAGGTERQRFARATRCRRSTPPTLTPRARARRLLRARRRRRASQGAADWVQDNPGPVGSETAASLAGLMPDHER